MTPEDAPALSFNEVAALATKAARGAGLGWGHAEDLGRASRWLAERGFAWDMALCRLLEAPDTAVRAGRLVEVCDWAAHAALGEHRLIDETPDAIWMAPLIAAAIFGRPTAVSVRGAGTEIHIACDAATAGDGRPLNLAVLAGPIRIEVTGPTPVRAETVRSRPDAMSPAALAILSALAERTLVPASDVSRATGAGAARTDND